MARYGICLTGFTAIRKEPKSSAEMISAAIFGETYEILKENDEWLQVKLKYDAYEGWLSKSNHTEIAKDFEDWQVTVQKQILLKNTTTQEIILLGPGCKLPQEEAFFFNNNKFKTLNTQEESSLNIAFIAKQFLGTPYLWGGKSIYSIDCSGLVQMVFKAMGLLLPRDSGEQAAALKTTVNFEDIACGDLVFFHKENKINHVGIALQKNEIIHASGTVHIDTLTVEGIVNAKNQLTHHLYSIKRWV